MGFSGERHFDAGVIQLALGFGYQGFYVFANQQINQPQDKPGDGKGNEHKYDIIEEFLRFFVIVFPKKTDSKIALIVSIEHSSPIINLKNPGKIYQTRVILPLILRFFSLFGCFFSLH
jgi:hypothetical protein